LIELKSYRKMNGHNGDGEQDNRGNTYQRDERAKENGDSAEDFGTNGEPRSAAGSPFGA
jgi:hypothetical protein